MSDTLPPAPLEVDDVLRVILDRFDQADRARAEDHISLMAHLDRRVDELADRIARLEADKERRHAAHDRHFEEIIRDMGHLRHAIEGLTTRVLAFEGEHHKLATRVRAIEEKLDGAGDLIDAVRGIEAALRERAR